MNLGDMKYTFTASDGNEQTIVIAAEVFRKGRRNGMTNRQIIDWYLFDQGLTDKEPEVTMETAKTKTTTNRTRKPNETKREIINLIEKSIVGAYGAAETTNPERQLRFEIDGNVYELTLVQKRK